MARMRLQRRVARRAALDNHREIAQPAPIGWSQGTNP
jgi:hypothetical protein